VSKLPQTHSESARHGWNWICAAPSYSIATLVRHLGTAGSVKYTGTGVWARQERQNQKSVAVAWRSFMRVRAWLPEKKWTPERHRFPSHTYSTTTSAAPPCTMHLPSPVAAPVFRPAAKAIAVAVAVARHVARGMGAIYRAGFLPRRAGFCPADARPVWRQAEPTA
jgi:hypothetical protein